MCGFVCFRKYTEFKRRTRPTASKQEMQIDLLCCEIFCVESFFEGTKEKNELFLESSSENAAKNM